MTSFSLTAPDAPAKMGQAAEPSVMLHYLDRLGRWCDQRRSELGEIDRNALAAAGGQSLTGDITLAMTLWQAVSTRRGELERVWDSGRVGQVELQRLSSLVWGRLDAGAGPGAGSLAVSLPEACRLLDVLVVQLTQRLSLEPGSADLVAGIRSLRADLERIRDLVVAEPSSATSVETTERLRRLDLRLEDVSERVKRGADVGGLMGSLAADAARAERDLIVAVAKRRDDERDLKRAHALRAELLASAERVDRVVAECVARVRSAPTRGVPRVEALGPVPDEPLKVDAYLTRLAAVERALALAEQVYRSPLDELEELRSRLDAYYVKASATSRGGDAEVAEMYRQACVVVSQTPTDLSRARAVVAAYQTLLGGSSSSPANPGRSS